MTDIRQLALDCREAAHAVARLPTDAKDAMLRDMADQLLADAPAILAANAQDMGAARAKGVGEAMLDRLRLDEARLAGVADALREVAALPDPVGQLTRRDARPNGISVERVRMPLGVVAMIYEARPNVTADAAALCLKAGNGVILRGGSEAIASNTAIAASLHRALEAAGVPASALTLVVDLRRETMLALLQLSDIVDLAIPRGGEGPAGAGPRPRPAAGRPAPGPWRTPAGGAGDGPAAAPRRGAGQGPARGPPGMQRAHPRPARGADRAAADPGPGQLPAPK